MGKTGEKNPENRKMFHYLFDIKKSYPMNPRKLQLFPLLLAIVAVTTYISCNNASMNQEKKAMTNDEMIARGRYMVTVSSCNDCHTPKIFGPQGMKLDSSRLLSGHTAGSPLPPIDTNALHPGYWLLSGGDLTAWVGPWGMTFTQNLTPDSATGIGAWTAENFVKSIRTGKHLGMDGGRPIMPPMPWEMIRNMTDEDLNAIFAYLKSLPAISNQVPAPVSPPDVKAMAMAPKP